MARARVELTGGLSYTTRGTVFRRGQPQYITDESLIRQLQGQSAFSVVVLEDPPEKAKAVKPEAPKFAAIPTTPAPQVEPKQPKVEASPGVQVEEASENTVPRVPRRKRG